MSRGGGVCVGAREEDMVLVVFVDREEEDMAGGRPWEQEKAACCGLFVGGWSYEGCVW